MQGGVYHQLFMGFFFPLSICVSISIFAVRSSPHHHHLTALHKGAQAHTQWWCMCIHTIPSSVWQKLTHTYSKKAPSAFLPLSVFSLQTYTTLSHTHTHTAHGVGDLASPAKSVLYFWPVCSFSGLSRAFWGEALTWGSWILKKLPAEGQKFNPPPTSPSPESIINKQCHPPRSTPPCFCLFPDTIPQRVHISSHSITKPDWWTEWKERGNSCFLIFWQSFVSVYTFIYNFVFFIGDLGIAARA